MPNYTVEWSAQPGDLYARMMMLMDMANGMFIIEQLHIVPGKWAVHIDCQKSMEHVRSMFTQFLADDFPMIDATINIIETAGE